MATRNSPSEPRPAEKNKNLAWRTAEGLLRIGGWARDGLADAQIAQQMNINKNTLLEWKKKYPEVRDALAEGKDVADRKVENALYKRALGYEYDEVRTTTRIVNGVLMKDAAVVKTRKVVMGDVLAQIIWLKNRKPATWRRGEDRGADTGAGVEDLAPLAQLLKLDADDEKEEVPHGG